MARLIAFAGLTAAAWKNGAGSTTEIVVFPPGAGFERFDWRLSVAAIAASGPFSVFAGIDRSLALLSGGAVALTFEGGRHVGLTPAAPRIAFAGERAVRADVAAPSMDFNVMTRRGSCRHRLDEVSLPSSLTADGGVVALFLAAGSHARARRGARRFDLGPYDTLLLDESDQGDRGDWELDGAPGARLLVARIFPA